MKETSLSDELEGFKLARDRLRLDHASKGVSSALRPLFSAATLGRLLKSEAEYSSESFSPAVRQRLLWAQRSPQDQGVYGGIEHLMGGSPLGRQIIRSSFVGDYAMFRYTRARSQRDEPLLDQRQQMKPDYLDLEFVEERIRIFFDDIDDPAFSYWSADAGMEPEQEGAVFYSIGKLFLAGVARDTMSMAILQVTHMGEPMHGFWTTTQSSGLRAPFSARVLLVQSQNETMLAKLRSKKEGAKTFFDVTRGSYAYYQTIE